MDQVRGRKVVSEHGPLSVVLTDDGSHTLYHKGLDETYHSLSGAVSESLHVFIREGLFHCFKSPQQQPLHILEFGWGSGLNSLLTMEKAMHYGIRVRYLGLEPIPLPEEIITCLNYPQFLDSRVSDFFSLVHRVGAGTPHLLSPIFSFQKIHTRLMDLSQGEVQEMIYPTRKFNLVYFDAFGMSKQEEPWQESNIIRLREMMSTGAVLVTYASNRVLRERLERQGFRVEVLSGPPPKREMIRATLL